MECDIRSNSHHKLAWWQAAQPASPSTQTPPIRGEPGAHPVALARVMLPSHTRLRSHTQSSQLECDAADTRGPHSNMRLATPYASLHNGIYPCPLHIMCRPAVSKCPRTHSLRPASQPAEVWERAPPYLKKIPGMKMKPTRRTPHSPSGPNPTFIRHAPLHPSPCSSARAPMPTA